MGDIKKIVDKTIMFSFFYKKFRKHYQRKLEFSLRGIASESKKTINMEVEHSQGEVVWTSIYKMFWINILYLSFLITYPQSVCASSSIPVDEEVTTVTSKIVTESNDFAQASAQRDVESEQSEDSTKEKKVTQTMEETIPSGEEVMLFSNNQFEPEYDYFIILEIKIGELTYNEYLDAYDANGMGNAEDIYLNFSQYIDMLNFPIEVDGDFENKSFNAEGWFIRTGNKLKVQGNTSNEQDIVIPAKARISLTELPEILDQVGDDNPIRVDYFFDEEDLYIKADLLKKWFNIDNEFDIDYGIITLLPSEPLPFQEKRLREKRRQVWLEQKDIKQVELPRFIQEYSLLKKYPMADISLSAGYSKDEISSSYSALIASDIAPLNVQARISGDNADPLKAFKIKASRDFDDEYLTRLELGNVNTNSRGLLKSAAKETPSVRATNKPKTKAQKFDSLNIEGTAKEGWEVELYKNNTLLAFKDINEEQYYNFKEVDIEYGENNIRVVKYGPQGQIEEEEQTYFVDSNLLAIDQFYYEASANENQIILEGEYGFSSSTSLYGGTAFQNDALFAYAGLTNTYGQFISNLDLLFNLSAEQAHAKYTLLTRWEDIALRFAQDLYHNNEYNRLSRTRLSATGSVKLFEKNVSCNFYGELKLDTESNIDYQIKNRLSANLFGMNFNNELNLYNNDLDGILSLRKRYGSDALKLDLNYSVLPEANLKNANLNWRHYFSSTLNSSVDLNYDMNLNQLDLGSSLNYKNENFITGLSFNLDTKGEYSVMASLSFSLYHNDVSNELNITSDSVASTGLIVASAFIDENYNGIKDDNEEYAPEVSYSRGGAVYNSGKSGIATINAGTGEIDLKLDNTTTPDPYIIAMDNKVKTETRSGTITHLNYPLVCTSELDGEVILNEDKAIGGIKLYLVNKEGERIKSTIAEYDGYFTMSELLPGEYFLTADTKDLEYMNAEIVENVKVDITEGCESYDGFEVHLIN